MKREREESDKTFFPPLRGCEKRFFFFFFAPFVFTFRVLSFSLSDFAPQ